MRLREVHGTMRHRLLLNYAADPAFVADLLPPGVRPQLVRDRAVVGVCVLRLDQLRPAGLPSWVGIGSDNAAHRVAAEWDGPDGVRAGVYVLRRDSAQHLPVLMGGRAFPGVHGPASFEVVDAGDDLTIAIRAADRTSVEVEVGSLERFRSRLFASGEEASAFFEAGSCGLSPDRRGGLEAVTMSTPEWRATPVEATARSSFFDDPELFPPGSIQLDSALLMRDLPVCWSATEA